MSDKGSDHEMKAKVEKGMEAARNGEFSDRSILEIGAEARRRADGQKLEKLRDAVREGFDSLDQGRVAERSVDEITDDVIQQLENEEAEKAAYAEFKRQVKLGHEQALRGELSVRTPEQIAEEVRKRNGLPE